MSRDPLPDIPGLTKVKPLGRGGFGSVGLYKRFVDRDGSIELVAVKVIELAPDDKITSSIDRYTTYLTRLVREVQSLAKLEHPHVVQLKRVELSPDCRHIGLVMEYADQGDLATYVDTLRQQHLELSEDEARWFFQQILVGLEYCHLRDIVNRDLKLANVLLSTMPAAGHQGGLRPAAQLGNAALGQHVPVLSPYDLMCKIADFGFCKNTKVESQPKSRCGTLPYMAPEVLAANANNRYDGRAADIWSTGIVLYVLLFGRYPFQVPASPPCKTAEEVFQLRFPQDVPVSQECKALLSQILTVNPSNRITLDGIKAHAWFTTGITQAHLAYNSNEIERQMVYPPRCEQMSAELNAVCAEVTGRQAAQLPAPQLGLPGQLAAAGGAAAFAAAGSSAIPTTTNNVAWMDVGEIDNDKLDRMITDAVRSVSMSGLSLGEVRGTHL